MKTPDGIEKKNRGYLDLLNSSLHGPFTVNEAAGVLKFEYKKAKRFAAYLASRGWLARVKNGYYTAVPIGTANPFELKEEPWVLASRVFAPCYIGGYSAAGYWDLSEQIFKDTVVFTEKKVTGRALPGFVLRTITRERMFGFSAAWVNNIKVNVSDPERTIVDLLNEPEIGGGIRNVSDIIGEYFISGQRKNETLLKYIDIFGNNVLYKRLGYIIEALNINAADVASQCLKKISKGYTMLDPSIKTKGKHLGRWNLNINAVIKKEE